MYGQLLVLGGASQELRNELSKGAWVGSLLKNVHIVVEPDFPLVLYHFSHSITFPLGEYLYILRSLSL